MTRGNMPSDWAIRSSSRRPLEAEVTGFAGCVPRTNFRKPFRAPGLRRSKPSAIQPFSWSSKCNGARHVEVQIIADHYGTTWAAGVRDCTIQRRHQKILEEAPSPALSPEQDQALREAAVRLSEAAGYHNAGTVEFLYEPESQSFLFHGDEYAVAGRTSGDRMHDRPRSGQTADSCRAWRTPGRRTSPAPPVMPSRCG